MSEERVYSNRPVAAWFVIIARILCAVACILVTVQSLRPAKASLDITHIDKVMHVMAYAVVTALFALAFPRLRLLYVFFWPALYGAFIEIVQAAMPYGRTGSLADLLANMIGGMFVILLWKLVLRSKNRFLS